jgi:hypothetical protein
LEANQAVSFLIQLQNFRDEASVQSLTLKNGQTQEQLIIRGANEFYEPVVSISRCSMGTNEEKWNDELRQSANIHNRKILFDAIH